MKKAIIKTKIHSRIGFFETLDSIGFNFEPDYWQHDRIFVPRNYDRNKAYPRLSLRTVVRKDGETLYALVMRQHFTQNNLDVINRTLVGDYAEAAHILYSLGYEFKAEVSRRRSELAMGETVRIYVDKIDGLDGYYAKIETILDKNESPEEAREDLIQSFHVLGVEDVVPINQTYGELIESSAHDIEDIPETGHVSLGSASSTQDEGRLSVR